MKGGSWQPEAGEGRVGGDGGQWGVMEKGGGSGNRSARREGEGSPAGRRLGGWKQRGGSAWAVKDGPFLFGDSEEVSSQKRDP